MNSPHKKKPIYQLLVVELDDVVPRRDPSKPNLLVALTVDNPQHRIKVLASEKNTSWHAGHIRKLRPDLAPSTKFRVKENAKAAEDALVTRLKSRGYTVNMDTRVWSLYVIELDPTAVSDPGKGYVYVGETSLSPEARFKQHMDGVRNSHGPVYSRVVNSHGIRLLPKLMPTTKYFDKESAKSAEKRLAERLEKRGYRIRGGH
jgi:predicted DNA-binding WGR domain protein